MTNEQLVLIETTHVFSLGEKLELLLVALGNKLTTELFRTISYKWNFETKSELPESKDLLSIEHVLTQLPFIFFKDQITKINRQTGRNQCLNWWQVSVNETVSKFMKQYPDDLTEFEEGILYGFPISAIRAFSQLIEARHETPNAATFYLAGWCSADFWDDEQAYYQLWWERIRKLSPTLVNQAEAAFNTKTKNQNFNLGTQE